jgi:ankyrin repeat protein
LDLDVKSLAYSWSGFQRNLVEIQDTRKFTDLVTVFNFAVPESFPGENLLRAETLSSGPVGDRCHELLKLLIFYISNNFERDSPFSASRSFRIIFELAGQQCMPLIELSTCQDMTILSFMENLFNQVLSVILFSNSSDETELHLDVLQWMFKCGFSPDTLFESDLGIDLLCRPLQAAVLRDCQALVRLLLRYGAVVDMCTDELPRSALQLALGQGIKGEYFTFHGASDIIIDLLLSEGAGTLPEHASWALHFAIRQGRLEIVKRICSKGHILGFQLVSNEYMTSQVTALTSAAEFDNKKNPDITALSLLRLILNCIHPNEGDEALIRCPESLPDLMISAAGAGNNDIIQYLIRLGGDVNSRNLHGIQPLHAAVARNRVQTCRLLLNLGADDNAVSFSTPTALHLAAVTGDIDILKSLVDSGSDINATVDVRSKSPQLEAMHRCLDYDRNYSNKLSHLKKDIKKNIKRNGSRCTPLRILMHPFIDSHGEEAQRYQECAIHLLRLGAILPVDAVYNGIYSGNLDCVNLVIQSGGDVNARHPRDFSTCLQAAVHSNHLSIVSSLLQAGANLMGGELIQAVRNANKAMVVELLNHGATLETAPDGETILEAAISSGDPEIVDWAFNSALQYSKYEPGALCAAVHLAVKTANVSPLEKVLRHRPLGQQPHYLEGTAVTIAASSKCQKAVDVLRNHLPPLGVCLFERPMDSLWGDGFVFDIPAKAPYTSSTLYPGIDFASPIWNDAFWRKYFRLHPSSLLFIAVDHDDQKMAAKLFAAGYKASEGCLKRAIEKGNNSIVEMILERGYLRGLEGGVKLAPIARAAKCQNLEMTRLLLQYGLDIEEVGNYGYRNALQFAVEEGNLELIEFLLNSGANINAKAYAHRGATALQIAAMQGFLGIASLLWNRGANVDAPGAEKHGRTALEGAAEHGRLDMVKLLLCYGVQTTGSGQRQYLRAIKFAEHNRHFVVASLLRSHREWSEEDEALMEDGTVGIELSDSESTDSFEYESDESDSEGHESSHYESNESSDSESESSDSEGHESSDSKSDESPNPVLADSQPQSSQPLG